MNNDSFYRAFEDRHRGSRELIKSRLEVYLPFIDSIKKAASTTCIGLDIGCGRGEWLEFLSEQGFEMHGVDLDQGMLDACQERGFNVLPGDGIGYLAKQASSSLDVISAFHVVEHISFDELQRLADEAQRVLKPGGLLILETPNPENLAVASANFYLDPTHIKPIPPMLLSFVTEFAGFEHNKVLRLQESKEIRDKTFTSLSEVINSVSPDYAVVAQKTANQDLLDLLKQPFQQEYGVSLNDLVAKFDNRFDLTEAKANEAEAKAGVAEAKASEAEAKASEAEAKAGEAEAKAGEAEAKAGEAEAKASEAEAKASDAEAKASDAEAKASEAEAKAGEAEAKANEAEAKANEAEAKASEAKAGEAEAKAGEAMHHLHLILNSKSWKITAPLRKLVYFLKWFKNGVMAWLLFKPHSRPRRIIKSLILSLKHKIARSPKLRRMVFILLKPFPKLTARLKRVGQASFYSTPPFQTQTRDDLHDLSPRAKQIYTQLKQAIENQKNKS